jgi:hypothetical protein
MASLPCRRHRHRHMFQDDQFDILFHTLVSMFCVLEWISTLPVFVHRSTISLPRAINAVRGLFQRLVSSGCRMRCSCRISRPSHFVSCHEFSNIYWPSFCLETNALSDSVLQAAVLATHETAWIELRQATGRDLIWCWRLCSPAMGRRCCLWGVVVVVGSFTAVACALGVPLWLVLSILKMQAGLG